LVRYDPDHESDDVVDRRGAGRVLAIPFRLVAGLLSWVGRRYGIVGVVVGLVVVGVGYALLTQSGPISGGPAGAEEEPGPPDERVAFVGFVLDDLQETWETKLDGYGRAKLVLFRDAVPTACGMGQSAAGPFYCPGDQQVYIDLDFFDALARLGGEGDFAQAYVIAHEVGHHIQNQANVLGATRGPDAVGPKGNAVRVELQADCLAGVWTASAKRRGLLEVGDVEEGLQAAAAIGDDRLQRESQGRVTPETFTHGTSAQRVRWFERGLSSGDVAACDTFAATSL